MLNPYFVKVLNFFRKRKEKRLSAKSAISTIEEQFNEHTNQAFDNGVEAGNSQPSKNAAMELQPNETYRQIGDNL